MNVRPARSAKKGWRRCDKCITCRHSENRFKFTSSATGESFLISQDITCKDQRVLYIIECRQCRLQYVGKTVQSLQDRGRQHIQAVMESLGLTQSNKLYQHFTTNGHDHSDILIYAIEIIHGDDFVLAARERFYIDKLQTVYKGLNSNRT